MTDMRDILSFILWNRQMTFATEFLILKMD